MEDTCGHADAWFLVDIPWDGSRRVVCFACACEAIQELPMGGSTNVERVGE